MLYTYAVYNICTVVSQYTCSVCVEERSVVYEIPLDYTISRKEDPVNPQNIDATTLKQNSSGIDM